MISSNSVAAALDAASTKLTSLGASAPPSIWAEALDQVTDLSRTALIAVLLTVLALRCLDILRELLVLLARPLAYFAMLVIAIHWLGIGSADLRAFLLPPS